MWLDPPPGTWQTWTPTYTNLTVGNGTVVARYTQDGKTVVAVFELTFGSTTTIDGTGPTISSPVTATSAYTDIKRIWAGGGLVQDATAFATFPAFVRFPTVTTLEVLLHNTAGTYGKGSQPSATIPMTWAVNDILSFTATYEAA